MVEPRELITVCRQIGGMMEAGVDFLRIMRVLSVQTTNPRLLEALAQTEHSLRLGASVSEALERSPDVFSPFAVSLVREGEARRDLAGAFLRIADFLQQEGETAPIFDRPPAPSSAVYATPPAAQMTGASSESLLLAALEGAMLRALCVAAGLFAALGLVWWSVEMGWVARRWQNVALCGAAALFLAGAALLLRRHAGSKAPQSATENDASQTFAAAPQMPQREAPPVMVPREAATQRSIEAQAASLESEAMTRDEARRRYGALADAPDALNVERDIYELNGGAPHNGANGSSAARPFNGAQPPPNEADFD